METVKSKSAFKQILAKSPAFDKLLGSTMELIAQVVGGTLGPGGRVVLIERQEWGLPPTVTKDGVTVVKSLGFRDAVQQVLLEAYRDCAIRTASEAGDGTTTATILGNSFYKNTSDFADKNKSVPTIKIIKTIQNLFEKVVIPTIENLTINCNADHEKNRPLLWNVARISANGDEALANAVLECFDITGDEGNVTIIESSGQTKYEVEKIDGFPIANGYEASCSKFAPVFINDPATQRVILEKPIFIPYFGKIIDTQTIASIIDKLAQAFEDKYLTSHNVVLMATGFSENVLAALLHLWQRGDQIKVFPFLCPQTAITNSEQHFLEDVAAVVGCEKIYDPITNPLNDALLEDLGNLIKENENVTLADGQVTQVPVYNPGRVSLFEVTRYRSTIIGHTEDERLIDRITKLKTGINSDTSEYEKRYLEERIAKLSGGVAKLKVIGASNGDTKERRDRAEDAVCSVRGALKYGALIGGGWTIINICGELSSAVSNLDKNRLDRKVAEEIMIPSLLKVVEVLFSNAGLATYDKKELTLPDKMMESIGKKPEEAVCVDIATGELVEALNAGILDSVPALREAIKNAISIATLLGTLNACVVFPRDDQADLTEARDANEFARMSNFNPNEKT